MFAALELTLLVASSSPSSQIIGGDAVRGCSWPSVVSLSGCSGTLIHPQVVVYAAHCGEDVPWAWFGEQRIGGEGFLVDVDYCRVNPDYVTFGFGEDYAFCVLADPVDVPPTPPLLGCELDLLQPDVAVTVVGFGQSNEPGLPSKRALTLPLIEIDDSIGEAVYGPGDGTAGTCNGDSGGPALVRDARGDGGWRVFGITSWHFGPNADCGHYSHSVLIANALQFIEDESGIDVTPCHDPDGTWNPSARCDAFPTRPAIAEGRSWDESCVGGPVTGLVATCGDPFVDATGGTGETGDSTEESSGTGEPGTSGASSGEQMPTTGAEPVTAGADADGGATPLTSNGSCGCRNATPAGSLLGLIGLALVRRRRSH